MDGDPVTLPGNSVSTRSFDPAADARGFRDALGTFATGVCVITAPGPAGPMGITANSFASVSLDPPLVLWSPAKASRRFGVFSTAPDFAIHVLAEDQRAICDGFTRDAAAFDRIGWAPDAAGVPLIEGCLARFRCRLSAAHDAGDHVIVVGEVTQVSLRPGAPLLFHAGGYEALPDRGPDGG